MIRLVFEERQMAGEPPEYVFVEAEDAGGWSINTGEWKRDERNPRFRVLELTGWKSHEQAAISLYAWGRGENVDQAVTSWHSLSPVSKDYYRKGAATLIDRYVLPSPYDGIDWKYKAGDRVAKRIGGSWRGHVVGFYSTAFNPRGYAVESMYEPGSVQIYPETALVPL